MDVGASKSVTDSCGTVGESECANAPTSDCAAYAAVRLKLRGCRDGLQDGGGGAWGDATRELGRLWAYIVADVTLALVAQTH